MTREVIDKWTGKPRPAWTETSRFGKCEPCEHCGSDEVIYDCPMCGAPVCCWKCCEEAALLAQMEKEQ